MKKKTSEGSVIGVVFYVLAVFLLVVACLEFYKAYSYVDLYVQSGKEVQTLEVIMLFLEQCVPYFTYAFLLYGVGYIINRNAILHNTLANLMCEEIEVVEEMTKE